MCSGLPKTALGLRIRATLSEKRMKPNLKGLLKEELVDFFREMDEPAYRAHQLMQWLYNKKVSSFEEMTNLPKTLREKLAENATVTSLSIQEIQRSEDGACKYLLRLSDGELIESVYIPDERRRTLCISSQVGCAFKCRFCATGKMGFTRQMDASEIVDQIVTVNRDLSADERIGNIVIMGMGEPLHNYKNLLKAVRLMVDESGLQIGGRKITISTVGLVPQIDRLADEGLNIRLAISLNASTNRLRSRLMPINEKYPIEMLIKSARNFYKKTGNRLTFEYVLIGDTNDSIQDANQLIDLTSSFPCKVNLIPYNPRKESLYRPSSAAVKNRFYQQLQARHPYAVTLRRSRGGDISAACGQLGIRPNG